MDFKDLLNNIRVPVISLILILIVGTFTIPSYHFGLSILTIVSVTVLPYMSLGILIILITAFSGYSTMKLAGQDRILSGVAGALTIFLPSLFSVIYRIVIRPIPTDSGEALISIFLVLFNLILLLGDLGLGFILGLVGGLFYKKK